MPRILIALEQLVDERRDHRPLRQDQDAADGDGHDDDRQQPQLAAGLQETEHLRHEFHQYGSLKLSSAGPGGSRRTQYVGRVLSRRIESASRPARRMTMPTGVKMTKKITPITTGLTTLFRTSPSFIQACLAGASHSARVSVTMAITPARAIIQGW